MKEIHSPQLVDIDPACNITDMVERRAQDSRNPVVYRVQKSTGNWLNVTASDFRRQVIELAKGLIASGIEAGDAVGIMSRTRYEWTLIDFAIWYAGGIPVPVYETSSPAQAAWALSHSGAKAVFVENAKLAEVIEQARQLTDEELSLVALQDVWVIDDAALSTLERHGLPVTDEQVEERRAAADLSTVATIVYTSGTTGRPKACPITHGNFVRLSANAKLTIPEIANETNSTLLFLPLAHVLGRLIQVLAFDCGLVVGHAPDVKNLSTDLSSFRPTMLLVVPRVFEKVYEGAIKKAEKGGKVNAKLFHRSVEVAVKWSQAKIAGNVPARLALQHRFYDKLVYSKLREAMGGRVRFAVSGGGRLAPHYGHFYHAVGIEVVEGYGLTETTAPLAVGRIRGFDIGNVGTLIPGGSARIAEDGELEFKGVGLIPGYLDNPEENAAAFTDDGWFRTGDLARIDEDGKLYITGRKKEIIVTAGGKNVMPVPAEDRLRQSPLVSQAMLVGDEKPFIAALITLDPDVLPDELERIGLPRTLTAKEASAHPGVHAAIQKFIDEANALVSKAESIREFRILDKDFTEAEGHLTPSMKVRRKQVLADFNSYVEDIYDRAKTTVAETAAHTAERVQEIRAEQSEKWEEFKAVQAEKLHEFTEVQGQKLHELADKIQQVAPLPGAKDKDIATDDAEGPVEKAASDWVEVTETEEDSKK
ncbi:long-chain fatty acid--CoA ligase [Rothia nasimurium]|uniref:Acyl-CoA synthetase n=1 Tax=Rothia nasimurium TaxID=85336 RepID=A0A1Y1RR02_9MICC|nr:AMP-dependent synthetase/ligase [Rothia nasimurium]ORC18926.1 long-chain fatty acid--CoA ligase [Rothia nasimurium]